MQPAAARAAESVLVHLGDLLAEIVLVGGAAIPLWVDLPGAPPARATNDTDVIVAARSRVHYHQIGERLRTMDFVEDSSSRVICRWKHQSSGALYDIMPLDPAILGFSNNWYESTFDAAQEMVLPAGTIVSVATPPYLLATKLVAFGDRGNGNYLASHDMHDIVALLDGCSNILDQIRDASEDVGTWLAHEFTRMLDTGAARDAILNYLPYDAPLGSDELLLEQFSKIATGL